MNSMASWFENNFTSWISSIWGKIKGVFKKDAEEEARGLAEPDTGQVPINDYISNTYGSSSIRRNPSSVYLPDIGAFSGASQTNNVSNNVNNSRTVGAVNVYVNSYGMDLATVSEELGTAVQQKLRMSGAIL